MDLASSAYRSIVQEIRHGTIQPGARLRVDRLATRYGISHTPVKQALARLQGEGIVVHLPNQGMRVCVLDEDDCRNVVEARLMCELFAVRQGLSRESAAAIAGILDLIAAYEVAAAAPRTDLLAWHDRLVRTDMEIHAAIVQMADNPPIAAWHAQLDIQLHGRYLLRMRDLEAVPDSVLQRSNRGHREIGRAMEWRDTTAAEVAITRHIESYLAVLNAPASPDAGRARRAHPWNLK